MVMPCGIYGREQDKFQETPDGKTSVRVINYNAFGSPFNADAVTVEYPSSVVEVYKYRMGGLSGAIVRTVTVTYLASNKKDLSSVEVT